jgi:bla regulator protein blaR1
MSTWVPEFNGLAGFWLPRLGHAAVEGGVAFGVAWLLCWAFAKAPANLKCWLWRLAYGKLLLALLLVSPIILPLLPSRSTPVLTRTEGIRVQPVSPAPLSTGVLVPVAGTASQPAVPRGLALPAWILLGWIAGALWRCGCLLRQWRKTASLRATGRPVDDAVAKDCCTQLSKRFGLARAPGLLTTAQVFRPLLIGPMRPAIILPAFSLESLGRENLKLAMAHELAHLTRRDLWWSWMPVLSTTVFWFHPLAWLSWREWRLAEEMACDELAVWRSRASVAEYARMLLEAAEKPAALATFGIAGTVTSYHHLERRFKAMKHFGSRSKPLAYALAALVALGGMVGLVPWKAVARPGSEHQPEPGQDRADGRERAPTPRPPANESREVSIPGTIEPKAKIALHALKSGVIETIGFQEGAPVQQGQLLVQLASPTLRAELAAAEAEFKKADLTYQRLRQIAEGHPGLVAAQDLESAQSALAASRANLELKQKQLAQSQVVAPWAGVIGASDIQPGEAVTPNTSLGTLYDFSAFNVEFAAPAMCIGQLHKGQKIQVRVEAVSPELLDGEIRFIEPVIDETTRTFRVKASLSKSRHTLWPGMYATVVLDLPAKEASHPLAAESLPGGATPPDSVGPGTSPKTSTAAKAATAPATKEMNQDRELLRQEISVVEKQVRLLRHQFQSGLVSADAEIAAQRDLFSLKRQLAAMDQDRAAEALLVEEELKWVDGEIAVAQQMFTNKLASEVPVLALEREKLSLQREQLRLR